MSRAGSLCRDPGTQLNATKINFAIIQQPCQSGQQGSQYCDAAVHCRHSRHLAVLRLHVLRAYCNFESKQAKVLDYFIWAMPK